MELRPYQQSAIDAVLSAYDAGMRRMLLVSATGTGKTVIFSELYKQMQSRLSGQMLVLAHTEELIEQNRATLQINNPNTVVGVEMAGRYSEPDAPIISASVQTLGRKDTNRVNRFAWDNIDKVIVDEAHHATATAYRRVFDCAGILDSGSRKLLLGTTATPARSDEVSLADIFEKVVYVYPIRQAIHDKWLVDIRGYRVRTDTSLAGVSKSGGDYAAGELSERVDTPIRNGRVVDAWKSHGENRKTVVFCADINHARDMASAFRDSGYNAEAVWGDDPERVAKLQRHVRGITTILCNCSVLTEGYNDPEVACVVVARPTQSNLLFTQMIGRGTRLAPNKKDLVVIDVVDGTTAHSLVTLPTLMGLPNTLDIKGRPLTEAAAFIEELQAKNPAVDFAKCEDIDDAKLLVEKVDMFSIKFPPEVENSSELTWYKAATGGYKMLIPKEGTGKTGSVHIYENALGIWELDGTIKDESFHGTRPSFEEAIKVADEQVRKRVNTQTLSCVKREALWHSKKVSGGQIAMLKRLFPHRDFDFNLMNSGQASRLISERLTRRAK
jgi:superfamily II DNA or RNA helicase